MTMGKNTRKKLFVDNSRLRNMEQTPDNSIGSMIGKKPRSILLGYFWEDVKAKSLPKISGSSKDLSATSIWEKNNYIREVSQSLH